jgi:hypothetical protein
MSASSDGPSGPLPRCEIRQPDPRCPRLRATARAHTIGVMPLSSRTPARTGPAAPRTALVTVISVVSVVALVAAGVLALGIGGSRNGGGATPAAQPRRAPAPSPKPEPEPGTFGQSQDVPTSFGAVAIDAVTRVPGSGRSGPMQAFVTMTNLLDHPVRYAPHQFRLLAGDARTPVGALRVGFAGGTLQPDASFSGELRFPAPRDGGRLWVEFSDRGKPILIDLTRTGGRTPDSAFKGFERR